jgi:CheY-like chemotaxis protein
VLVVDDDADVRDSITDVLTDEGYRVLCAEEGAEALALLPGVDGPLVLVVDLKMPGMDGQTLIGRVRADPVRQRTPIIVCTASRSVPVPPDVERVLQKPFGVDALLDAIRRAAV